MALTIGAGTTKMALTDKDFTSIGKTMADAMGTAPGGIPGPSKDTATIVTCCVSNAVRAVSVAKKIRAGDLEGAFTDVVGAIAAELKAFDPVKGGGAMTFIGRQMAGTAIPSPSKGCAAAGWTSRRWRCPAPTWPRW